MIRPLFLQTWHQDVAHNPKAGQMEGLMMVSAEVDSSNLILQVVTLSVWWW